MNITNLDNRHQSAKSSRYPFLVTATSTPSLRWLSFLSWLLLLLLWVIWLLEDSNARYLAALFLPYLSLAAFFAVQSKAKDDGQLWIQSRDSLFFYKNKEMIPIKILPESRFYPQFMLLSFQIADGQKKQWLLIRNQPEFSRWLLYFLHEMDSSP
jgi:hypothetical protein